MGGIEFTVIIFVIMLQMWIFFPQSFWLLLLTMPAKSDVALVFVFVFFFLQNKTLSEEDA